MGGRGTGGSRGGSSAPAAVTKTELLSEVKALKGQALEDAIDRADSLGSYYREDKRQKRGYIEGIAQNMWKDNPTSSDDIDSNLDVLYIVRGVPKYSPEAVKRARAWEKSIYGE